VRHQCTDLEQVKWTLSFQVKYCAPLLSLATLSHSSIYTTAINLEIHISGYRITISIAPQRFNMEHPPEPDNSASMSLQQNNSSKAVILASGLVDITHMSEHIAAMSVFLRSEFYRITDASSATRNAATSRLLQLPGELRNQIWEVRPGYTTTVCDIR